MYRCNIHKLLLIFSALMLATLLCYTYFIRIPIQELCAPDPSKKSLPQYSTASQPDHSYLHTDSTNRPSIGTDTEEKYSAGFRHLGAADNPALDRYIEPDVGRIWPRRNGIETNDRVVNQINFISEFWPRESGVTSKPLPLLPHRMKVILKVGVFNFRYLKEGQLHFIEEGCPANSCTITGNQSVRLTADALIMSEFSWNSQVKYLPKPSHQIWIAQHFESPKHNRINPGALKNLINWTATYRRDSTVRAGYGNFVPVVNATPTTGVNYASGKTKKVAWLVKNCKPSNHRKSYASELSRYIDIDIYGPCGTKKCPANGSCMEWIGRHYKFYLAFENSNCKDYITEKFFHNSLSNNILPIVLGAQREDYLAVAPPMSYIHVDDYPTASSLAAYLHHLDNNDTAYNEYFAWKGTMLNIKQRYWCRICTLLHLQQRNGYVHWYGDYASWWNGACNSASTRYLSLFLLFNVVIYYYYFTSCEILCI